MFNTHGGEDYASVANPSSHHSIIYGVLEHFHKFMKEGDYIVYDDTDPETPIMNGMGWGGHPPYEALLRRKRDPDPFSIYVCMNIIRPHGRIKVGVNQMQWGKITNMRN